MRKIITILLLCAPALALAQLSAPTADYRLSTTGLTGNVDSIYVFYDMATMSLTAAQPNGHTAEFTWKKLNVAGISLDLYQQDNSVVSSTITDIEEGGYQVAVRDLVDVTAPIDTFTAWVFRDTFRINSITYEIDCDLLRLEMHTTPDIFSPYTIYNFQRFLTPPHVGATTAFSQVQLIEWTPVNTAGNEIDIFPNINNPNNSWRTRQHRFTFIDNPAPLVDAAYHLEVTDVFGKSATYTTPNTIHAISTKAIPTVQEYVNNNWNDAGEQPQGEALYKVRFKHDKVTNATNYTWKGFANSRQTNGDKTVVWTESTTNANAEIPPQMPYNGKSYDGYTPGSYQVRLIVRNNVCADSVAIPIVVDPSAFDVESIPNAFTPNDDGRNDVFTFVSGHEPISMEYIYVYIYSRSGGLVYRYEGRSDEWEGWNGRMMGTGSDVSEGVYYYVISGRGWDDINYNTKEYSGYLHLFR